MREILHPQAEQFLRVRDRTDPSERDQDEWVLAFAGGADAVREAYDSTIDGPGGPLRIRVYRPHADPPLPIVCYFHGGGWSSGSVEQVEVLCRALANRGRSAVVSVDYRLVPQHPFPSALEDCLCAVRWAVANAETIGGDSHRVAVAGESAGGQLAAGLALRARERGHPRIGLQILIYPALDAACEQRSFVESDGIFGMSAQETRSDWKQYLAGTDPSDPIACPLRADDLSGLPPAVVITAECDVLRDEGEAYAAGLRAAGVGVMHKRFAGQIHGFVTLGAVMDDTAIAVDFLAAAIEDVLHRALPESPVVHAPASTPLRTASVGPRGPGR